MRCAIYARFSTDRQSANSAEDQVAACTARAQREGWDIAGVYTDAAISGASNRRPGMTGMLADAAAGAFDIVLAEAIDRIARNQADIATIYQRLEFADVAIETLSEGRVNELHIGLKGTMSALFLKDLADKIRRGQRGAVGRGKVPGGLAYGYEVVPTIGANGELDRGLRRINEDQARVIRRIYDEYLAGRGPKAIALDLNAEGIPSARGGEWRGSAIAGHRARGLGVLHNPIYAGRYLYNRVRMVRDPESRRRISRVNPADERVEVAMPELAIVSEATWQQVQDAAAQRSTGAIVSHRRPRHLLAGLLICGACGGSMTGVGGRYIGCARAREAGTCDVRATIARSDLEQRVMIGIADRLLQPDAVSRLVKTYHGEANRQRAVRTDGVAALERRIATAERAVKRLVAAIAEGAADFSEIREALAARKSDLAQLRRERDEATAMPVIALNPGVIDAYRQRVRNLVSRIEESGAHGAEIKARLRNLIDGVKLTSRGNGEWDIEVLTSLSSVIDLATKPNNKQSGGSKRSAMMVAEDRFLHNRRFRTVKV